MIKATFLCQQIFTKRFLSYMQFTFLEESMYNVD